MNQPTPRRATRALLTAMSVLSVAAGAYAIQPKQFSQTTEADFADGDPMGTVVTNLGDVRLSSDTTTLEGLPEDVTVIHDVVKTKDGVFFAAGPEAKILMLTDAGVKVVAAYEGEQVFALTAVGSDVIVGVSGSGTSRLDKLDSDGVETLVKLPDVTYIWDLLFIDDKIAGSDELVIATGPTGKVLRVTEKDLEKVDVLLETSQSNILSLAADGKGNIYAGTDTDGLVYRIDREGNPFVVYDAAEPEVAALTVMPDGTVYAGTAAADQARPGRMEQPVKEENGRPEAETSEPKQQPEEDAAEAPAEAADQPEPEADAASAGPTTEQYDALREAVRQRLEVARETGQLAGGVGQGNGNAGANANNRPSRAKPAAPAGGKKQGNAIYQIAPDGFVSEVFRESAMILAIVPNDGKLIVATGNEGQVFSVDPALRETTVLTDLDSAQVMCATPTDDGLLLGAANPGALIRMDTAMARDGSYTSQVLDAGQVSLFGVFKLTADIPANTSVTVELRSGNVGDPEQAAWSKWSEAVVIKPDADADPLQPREVKVEVPPARYLQYRLTLTGDGSSTPVIDQADLAYVAPNTPPSVASLTVNVPAAGEPGSDPNPKYTVQWQATDDNADRLVYTLEYKPGRADRYLPLAEELTSNKYDWSTQHVPDGWYTVRLTAHDRLDNPADSAKTGSRVSEPVLVDNTAPTLEGLQARAQGGGKVVLKATAGDELSAIRSVSYSVDGGDDYKASLPDDLIYDSTSEPWGVIISDLSPGEHVISVRVIDARGNTAYRNLIVDVE